MCQINVLQKLLLLDPRGPFSCNDFLATLSTMSRALDLQTDGYSGYNFRKGAARHVHDSGILDDQIQVLGRWTSENFRVHFTTNALVFYKLNHQFHTDSPVSLSLLPPPSAVPSTILI